MPYCRAGSTFFHGAGEAGLRRPEICATSAENPARVPCEILQLLNLLSDSRSLGHPHPDLSMATIPKPPCISVGCAGRRGY